MKINSYINSNKLSSSLGTKKGIIGEVYILVNAKQKKTRDLTKIRCVKDQKILLDGNDIKKSWK